MDPEKSPRQKPKKFAATPVATTRNTAKDEYQRESMRNSSPFMRPQIVHREFFYDDFPDDVFI